MIELLSNNLQFSFPEVHELASVAINFQRTLRIPDNDQTYPLPPGLGTFPIKHVDDYQDRVPESWKTHGGVFLPMYQSEALWIYFRPKKTATRASAYPFAIKISAGKIDALTGAQHTKGLHKNPQDFVVAPGQPWLDGFCVKKGIIRQFVAMPLGQGYSAEEQITGKAEHGGVQIVVYPMKAEVFDSRFPHIPVETNDYFADRAMTGGWGAPTAGAPAPMAMAQRFAGEMGLGAGGRMKQEIFKDTFDINDWDTAHSSRCFVHFVNSHQWREITGLDQPQPPVTAEDYARYKLPWFDYYDDKLEALSGSSKLANLQSVQVLSQLKGEPIPNKPIGSQPVVNIKSTPKVREGDF